MTRGIILPLTMRDLTNSRAMYAKGVMFVLIGVISSVLLILEKPTVKVGLLLALAVWGFARAYYFAFYVIEKYVDPGYRFAGLWAFSRYLMTRSRDRSP